MRPLVVGGFALAVACTPPPASEPDRHPCDQSRPGPHVAPPYDARELLEDLSPEDRGRCQRAGDITAATDDDALRVACEAQSTCGTVCLIQSRAERARLRAAEISAALLELRERIDALEPGGPCAGLRKTGARGGQDAVDLASCAGVGADLPQLVILVPGARDIELVAARYPVDCSAPAWAVDWKIR